MYKVSVFIGLISIFLILPVTIYGSWLLYIHIGATPLMWFLWWISIPWSILINIFGVIAKEIEK